jgi:adenine phosphoribosyltransferase
MEDELKRVIVDFPDYPKPGIMFKDISPILMDMNLYRKVINEFASRIISLNIDLIVGIESRGFWFGPAIADKLNIPFIPIRKKGKLPGDTFSKTYTLEYGSATIEIQKDRLKKGSRVLIHDDLLATGGTAGAASELVKIAGAEVVGFAFLVNLTFLKEEQNLNSISNNIISIVNY